VFLVVLGLINSRISSEPTATGLILLTTVLLLAVATATLILPLALSVVIMMLLVALLLAYHLTAARQSVDRPESTAGP
jgi:hypothetical protein